MNYSQGTWSEGRIVNGTNVGGGVFTPTPAPVDPTYSRLPEGTTNPPAPTNTPKITPTVDIAPTPAFDEAATRNAAIAARESEFSGINQLYDQRIKEATLREQKLGATDLARANTISAMTGMSGGVDATSRAGGVERKTADIIKQNEDMINAQRYAAISGIYSKIDQNVQREKELAITNSREERSRMVDDMNKSAQSNIMEFATQGIAWDKAYADPEFQAEVKRSGKSPFEIQTAYEKSLPQGKQPKEIFSGWKGDNFVTINQNADGTTSTKTITASELGLPKGSDVSIQSIDGAVYMIDKANPYNADGTPKLMKLGSKTTSTPITGAPQGMSADDIEEGRRRLTNVGSYQGYANSYLYRDMFDLWVKNGGDRAAFIKAYPPKQYINPAHNTLKDPNTGEDVLPEYLRTKATESTDTVTRPTFGG